ncbi:phosphoinositide 3-kinase adapter protein 1 isoform X1 [Schistocerca nitens]|uniref:phosphoinositide 3-kinase adapter protein 1 isoform X1 n=2 Tax=Schistocerca nitens TaxID=7011 RepID=UPI002117E5BD|nr:phosphoinositide 3-kinase adapter protein 1 isoform X1 [Schistocerca nitens]
MRSPQQHAAAEQGSGRMADMEDIVIISSKQSHAAELWVRYLKYCFEEVGKIHKKPPYKVLCVGIEEIAGASRPPPALEEKMVRVKLQVVVMCSKLLDHVYNHPGPSTALGRLLQPERVVALLLGVEESSVTEQHRAALISYLQWRKMTVKDQDEVFVRNLLDTAMGILSRASRQQRKHGEKAQFSLHPKKVKERQSKVLVLLNEPLGEDDKVNVSVDKNGERLQIATVSRKNPYAVYFQLPESCLEVSMLVTIYVEKNGQSLGGHLLKCESKMRQLDQILRSSDNPLEFMCQTLGFSPGDREHLDNFLVAAFQRNVPAHFNLLHGANVYLRSHSSPEEYPTLLHFAARHGLEKLACQLLDCPGGEQACIIRNVCDLTPAEMADRGGHSKLAQTLRGYMQMTEFTSMYSYLKIMSEEKAKSGEKEETDYLRPRPLSETYQVPPSARTLMEQNYQIPPTARPYNQQNDSKNSHSPASKSEEPEYEIAGYMEMHPSGSPNSIHLKNSQELTVSPTRTHNQSPSPMSSENTSVHHLDQMNGSEDKSRTGSPNHSALYPLINNLSTTSSPARHYNRSPSPINCETTSSHHLDQLNGSEDKLSIGSSIKKSQDHLNYGTQDELIEIINDFKNNVVTISEVEKFVEAWKNRNDVQQSFKEKQAQLNLMREEYERIQRQMKEHMRRPTPFDRIRNFFRGKAKEAKDTASETSSQPSESSRGMNGDVLSVCQRPASSLSLHSVSSSSTSSGRMSTVSGCSGTSMGDSGTHSDTEDRKHICDFSKMNGRTTVQNYEVPPAPRPLQAKWQSPHLPTCIEDRPPQPVPRPDLNGESIPVDSEERASCGSYIAPDKLAPPGTTGRTLILKSPVSRRKGYIQTEDTQTEAEYLKIEASESNEKDTVTPLTPNSPAPDYMNVHVGIESNFPDYMNVEISNNVNPAPPIPPRGKITDFLT